MKIFLIIKPMFTGLQRDWLQVFPLEKRSNILERHITLTRVLLYATTEEPIAKSPLDNEVPSLEVKIRRS